MTTQELRALREAGIVGKIEFLNGVLYLGPYELHFSREQAAAAAKIGLRVRSCADLVLEDETLQTEIVARHSAEQADP